VRSGGVAAEPAQERDRRGGGVTGYGNGLASGGGAHEAAVLGGSVQVGDVLGGDVVELGMHGWPRVELWCGHCDPHGLQRACSPVNARPGHCNRE
jgi:hypothetical protein